MVDFQPSLLSLVRLIFGDTWRIIRAMPDLAITAFLICVGESLARMVVVTAGLKSGRELIAAVLGLGFVFLLMPFVIAGHRFIILKEVTRGYSFQAPNPRVLKFYGTWIILGVVGAVPLLLALALTVAAHTLEWWIIGAVALALVIGLTILCLRMTILLPAIAIDAPGANWLNAYHDSKGHALGIFVIYFAVLASFAVAALVAWSVFFALIFLLSGTLVALSFAPPAVAALLKVVTLLATNAVALVAVAQMVAVASRLYQMFGDQVKHPPSQLQVV